jgi:four helix bundle protein
MTEVKSFRDLRIWQRAMDLVPAVYRLLDKLPREEEYGLAEQVRRAVVSVPANIAEGHARKHTKEFLQHLSIARGSLAELLTLLLVAERLNYLAAEDVTRIEQQIADLAMPMNGLIRRLQARAQG